jgi:hypothetical protein
MNIRLTIFCVILLIIGYYSHDIITPNEKIISIDNKNNQWGVDISESNNNYSKQINESKLNKIKNINKSNNKIRRT